MFCPRRAATGTHGTFDRRLFQVRQDFERHNGSESLEKVFGRILDPRSFDMLSISNCGDFDNLPLLWGGDLDYKKGQIPLGQPAVSPCSKTLIGT